MIGERVSTTQRSTSRKTQWWQCYLNSTTYSNRCGRSARAKASRVAHSFSLILATRLCEAKDQMNDPRRRDGLIFSNVKSVQSSSRARRKRKFT